MLRKQVAWVRVLVMVALIIVYSSELLKLYNMYGDLIPGVVFSARFFFQALPVIGWLIVGVMLYVLVWAATTSLIKTCDN